MFSCHEISMLSKCYAILECIVMIRRRNSFCLEFPRFVYKNMYINDIEWDIKNSSNSLVILVGNEKVFSYFFYTITSKNTIYNRNIIQTS